MKPIIKWSGGKSQEIKFFEHKFPESYKRYVEPFAGGAGVYFNIEHNNSIINDVNFELISLYQIVGDFFKRERLITHLKNLDTQRKEITRYSKTLMTPHLFKLFDSEITKELEVEIPKGFKNNMGEQLEERIKGSVKDKIKRIQKIEEKENKKFVPEEYKNHFETALQSAFYFYSRDIYNKGYKEDCEECLEYYIANWYYVREFCYSSMFRFSKNGNFNVPYGGIGYNSKDFLSKVEILNKNEKLHHLLTNTEINKLDFQKLFEKYNYFEKEDFIFLDPPYDSEFSQYNKEGDFDKKEQIRLRDELLKINAKIMVVIKETDFIYDLYKKDFKIEKFDKKYMTNMRNRNNKDVQHLIITNY